MKKTKFTAKTQSREEKEFFFASSLLRCLILLSAFQLFSFSAFSQNPSVFQPIKRVSGSLAASNVFDFNPDYFTNSGGTISLRQPPPPGYLGTNSMNPTIGKIPYKASSTNFGDSALRRISDSSIGLTNSSGSTASLVVGGTNASGVATLSSGAAGSTLSSGGGLGLTSASGSSFSFAEGANKIWLLNKAFYPNVSNDISGGVWNLPYADWFSRRFTLLSADGTTNVLTGTNGTLYLNGVKVGGGPWTDDGTSIFPTANPSAMQLADDGSGVNFGIPIDGLARNFRFASDDGTNASLVLFENTTTNMEVLFQYQPDYNGSGTIGNFDFRLIDDGASNGLSMFSMMSGGQNTFIVGTNGSISLSGTTNLIGDNGSGITWNGLPVSPWFDNGTVTYLNRDTNAIQISDTTGAMLLGTNAQSYWGPLAGNEVLISFRQPSLGENTTSRFEMTTSDDSNGDYSGQIFFLSQTNAASGGAIVFVNALENSVVSHIAPGQAQLEGKTNDVRTWNIDENGLSLSSRTNLIGMSAGGQLTVDGVPIGGGSQTPWTSDIDGNQKLLTNVSAISVQGITDTSGSGALATNNSIVAAYAHESTNSTATGNRAGIVAGYLFQSDDTDILAQGGAVAAASFEGANTSAASAYDGSFAGGLMDASAFTDVGADSGSYANATAIGAADTHVLASGGSIASGVANFANQGEIKAYQGSFSLGIVTGAERIWSTNGSFAMGQDVVSLPEFSWTFGKHYTNANPGLSVGYSGVPVFEAGTNGFRFPDTNGLGGWSRVYASTNSGSAVLYTSGSPPTATVPIDETSGAYKFPNTVTTNLVIPLVATIRITNGLVMAVTGP